ncbi:MAG: hypothetical protein ABSD89_05310 [Halobacteriota archaeon]|jgi:hypothetical protein
MSSEVIKARIQEVKKQAKDRQRKIITQLKILTVSVPIATVGANYLAVGFLVYTHQSNLLGPSSFLYITLGDSPVRNLVLVTWFAFAIFFSIEAFYFLSLRKSPLFITLCTDASLNATTDANKEHTEASKTCSLEHLKAVTAFSANGRMAVIFGIIFVAIATYGNIGMVIFRLYVPSFYVPVYVLMVSALACFWFGYRVLGVTGHVEEFPIKPRNNSIQEVAGVLPQQVRVNESHDIMMEFSRSNLDVTASDENAATESCDYFETELRAAGVTVDGDKRMPVCEDSHIPTSIWNCCFQNAGNQTIMLILSVVSPSNHTRRVVFTHEHNIKVQTAFSVSFQSAVAIIVSSLSAISGVIAIAPKLW